MSGLTGFINALLQRLGAFFSQLVHNFVLGFFQVAQYFAGWVISFISGILADLISMIPGVSTEQSYQIAEFVRVEIAKWNTLFPVYEAVTCLSLLFGWRIFVSLYRAVMTIIWNSANLRKMLGI